MPFNHVNLLVSRALFFPPCLLLSVVMPAQTIAPHDYQQDTSILNRQVRPPLLGRVDSSHTEERDSSEGTNSMPEIRNGAPARDDASTQSESDSVQVDGEIEQRRPGQDEHDGFRDMVEESSGQTLTTFGKSLFAEGAEAFRVLNRAPALDDYILGLGDEVIVRAWGAIDVDYAAVVDSSGQIFLPHVGSIPVAGIRYTDLELRVRAAIDKGFKNYGLAVSLGKMRTVPVLVVGNVRKPGIYAVNAVSTVLSALAAAGGPASNGSMRHIEVQRAGRLVITVDLYSLLLNGSRLTDVRLIPGDVVHVFAVGPRIALAGNVITPGIYEINSGETVASAIAMAGGFSMTAKTKQISVERIVDHAYRNTFEVSAEAASSTPLEDGDLLLVPHISEEIRNSVTLRGAVADPIRREWRPGLRVRDVIESIDALVVPTYWKQKNAELRRPLEKENPEQYRIGLKHSFGEINWNYAVIERLDPDTLCTRLLPFNLAQAMQRNPEQNLELKPGDAITVFSKRDILVSSENQTRYVRVEGEVHSPGVYLASPSDTLSDMIQAAGGLTSRAFLYGAQLTRESVRVEQEEHVKRILAQWESDVNQFAANQTSDATSTDEATRINLQTERARAMVARLLTMPASGRIALGLEESVSSTASLPAMKVEDGDRIFIPVCSPTVTVAGAVFNEGAFTYQPGKNAEYYVQLAGGLKSGEKWNKVYVLKANGEVSKANHLSDFPPGSGIVVMPSVHTGGILRNVRDWSTVLYQFGLGAAALNVLK